MSYIYASIEIGSWSIRFLVSEFINNKIHVLYKKIINESCLRGIMIANPKKLGEIVDDCVQKANFLLKVNITKVILVVPSANLDISQVSQKHTCLEKTTITNNLIEKIKHNILEKKQDHHAMAPITIIPSAYYVDKKPTSFKPIGQLAFEQIAIEGYLYSINKNVYENYLSIFANSKTRILDVVLDIFASSYEAMQSVTQRENAVIIDYGYSSTTISYFYHQFIVSSQILPFGTEQIDKDINYLLKLENIEGIPKLRKTYTKLNAENTLNPVVIKSNCYPVSPGKFINFTSNELNYVVKARIIDTFEKIYKYSYEMTNGNLDKMYLIGGGSSFYGLQEFFEKYMQINEIEVYKPTIINAKNVSLVNVLGAVKYKHINNIEMANRETSLKNNFNYTLKKGLFLPKFFSKKKLFQKWESNKEAT